MYTYTHTHTYMHTNIAHTYIHTYTHTYMHRVASKERNEYEEARRVAEKERSEYQKVLTKSLITNTISSPSPKTPYGSKYFNDGDVT